jgi:Flp pilus assembly protein TadG
MTAARARMRFYKRRFAQFWRDRRGVAATEFAIIVPFMLVAFFGVEEFYSAIAVDRKVTLMAKTLSDLTSRNVWVDATATNNFFAASYAILYPYDKTPTQSTITELYVDPNTLAARVQWSVGSNVHSVGSTIPIPADLKVGGTYLIYSEVNYQYVPTVGYVLAKSGIPLSDVSYTRPRYSLCVLWGSASGVCPTS